MKLGLAEDRLRNDVDQVLLARQQQQEQQNGEIRLDLARDTELDDLALRELAEFDALLQEKERKRWHDAGGSGGRGSRA